jgi:hypothetical protein
VNNFKTTTKLKSGGQQDFHTQRYLPHIFTQHFIMALECRFEHFLWNPLCPQIQNTLHTIQPGPSKNRKPTRKKQKNILKFLLAAVLPCVLDAISPCCGRGGKIE